MMEMRIRGDQPKNGVILQEDADLLVMTLIICVFCLSIQERVFSREI